MITIDLLQENAFGEPPPNLVWRGAAEDFLNFALDIHGMICSNGNIRIRNDSMFLLSGMEEISFSISGESLAIVRTRGRVIETLLSKQDWKEVFYKILSVTFAPSHNYIEFDDKKLIEDANWIIESL